jgi:hypothetical protein
MSKSRASIANSMKSFCANGCSCSMAHDDDNESAPVAQILGLAANQRADRYAVASDPRKPPSSSAQRCLWSSAAFRSNTRQCDFPCCQAVVVPLTSWFKRDGSAPRGEAFARWPPSGSRRPTSLVLEGLALAGQNNRRPPL